MKAKPKEKIYLDTSILSAYLDPRDPRLMRITKKFWKILKNYDVYISTIVTDEIIKTPNLKRRHKLSQLAQDFKSLEVVPEIDKLVKLYLKEKVIPLKVRPDAYHLAIATFYEMDILVSWNLKHIVKHQTRIKVNALNKLQSYHKELSIITPEEL